MTHRRNNERKLCICTSRLLNRASSWWLDNPLTPNDHYSGRTAPLTSKRCILYIYSTNIGIKYFKHGIYYSFFLNAVCFIVLTYLVPVLYTFYIQNVLKLKKNNSGSKRIKIDQLDVTCFIISLFTAQHVSNVSTSILRELANYLSSYFMGCIALVRCVLVLRCGLAGVVWYPYAGINK